MANYNYGGSSLPKWESACNGRVPPGAFVGGKDLDSDLYIARARHGGGWVPGKLNPNHGKCYIPWGGKEVAMSEYEVLCGSNLEWQRTAGGNVPPRSVPASNAHEGEVMYVGRVHHNGTSTVGKVHPSHGVCYIPFGGEELSFSNYEVLVSRQDPDQTYVHLPQLQRRFCGDLFQSIRDAMVPVGTPDLIPPTMKTLFCGRGMPTSSRGGRRYPVSYPAFKQVSKQENWVFSNNGNIPPGCFVGGHDFNSELYVGRAHYNGDIVPGKVNGLQRTCYIPWGGKEIRMGSFEVLQGDHLEWICSQGSRIPEGAVHGGRTRNGEVLYIGRVDHNGTRTVGKIQPSIGACAIPYNGLELNFPHFEVLVKRSTINSIIYEGTNEKIVIPSITWVEARNGSLPPTAFSAGFSYNTFYVGRAQHGDEMIPGKVQGDCFYPFNGLECRKDEYQVLCGRNLSWTSSSDGKIPNNAVHGGRTSNGEVLFIGRVNHQGNQTVGKVHPSHRVCYIAYGGREIPYQNYEILISYP
ncbi:uncharacterized protein LOC124160192 isoform X2 [Ischnura elegans]|uniref:uncharacterized protein LOC124160192 isoform X1 n=1 Tax=Ischnura elegans TaxID=197161 RepID=UPI001ED87915|nr:uncharacterized protein LOC124160192 isoform X1 [Ischnura elegans]XP_046391921.1 uncharacterized protein LOC124160192 isoform X2 [Ischnura elegans]